METKYKKDDKVLTNLGRGVVVNVDTTTYSIVMCTVELTGGHHIGEFIVKCEDDLMYDNWLQEIYYEIRT